MRSDFDGVDFTLDGVFGSFGLLGLAWLASVTVWKRIIVSFLKSVSREVSSFSDNIALTV